MGWLRRRRAKAPKVRRSWWRRVLRWLAIGVGAVVGLVVLVVGAVLVLLHTDWGRATAVRLGLGAFNDTIRGEVRVERLEGSVFGSFAVVGAEVLDPEGVVVASAARIEVEWDPWALLDERVSVQRALVVEPSFTLQDAQGQVGIARAFEAVTPSPTVPSTGPSAWVVLVERAILERGSYAMGPREADLGLRDIAVDVAVRVAGADVVWEGLEVSGTATGLDLGPVRVVSSGRFGPEGLRVDAALIEAAGSRIRARGTFGTLDRPRIDVRIEEAHVDLAAVARALPGASLQGAVDLQGRAYGGYDGAAVELDIAGSGGRAVVTGWAALASGGMRWEATLQGRDLAPSGVITGLEMPLVVDLDLTVRGKGGPMTGGRASIAAQVLRLEGAPAPPLPLTLAGTLEDGRVRAHVRTAGPGVERIDLWTDARIAEPRAGLEEDAPPRETPVGAAPLGGTVGWDIRGLDLRLVGALANMPGLTGRIEGLSGAARAAVPGDGAAPAVSATVALTAHDVHLPEDLAGSAVDLGPIQLRAAGSWAGEPVPTVAVDVSVAGAQGFDATLGRLRASVGLSERGGEAHARGRVIAQDARWQGRAAVDSVWVPFEALSPLDAKRLPIGRVSVTLRGARFEENAVGYLKTDQVLTHVGRSDRTGGPLTADRISSGAVTVASVGGTVKARKGGVTGSVRIDAVLGARSVRFGPDERAARVDVDARVRLLPGKPGVTTEGTAEVRDLRAAKIVRVAATRARFEGAFGRGRPVVKATIHAATVELPQRTLDTLDLRAALGANGGVTLAGTAADGEVNLSVDVSGSLPRRARDPITATLRELRLEGPAAGIASTGAATVRFDPRGDVEVHGLELAGLGELPGSISIDGAWGRERFDGTVDVRALPIGQWVEAARHLTGLDAIALPGVDGTVTIEATTSGPASAPTAHAKIQVEGGRFEAIDGVGIDLEASVEPGWARVSGFAAWKGTSRIDLDVKAPVTLSAIPFSRTWVEDQPLTARVDLQNLDLADLRQWVPTPLSGAPLSGTVRSRIDLSGPRTDVRGTVSLSALDLALGPLKEAELRGQITLDESGTRGTIAAARGGKGLLRTTLDIPLNLAGVMTHDDPRGALVTGLSEQPFAIRVELDELRLAELPYTEPLGRELRRVVAGMDISLKGTLREPLLEGRIGARELPAGNGRANLTLTVATVNQEILADLLVATKVNRLIEGRVRLPKTVTRVLDGGDPRELLMDPRLLVWLATNDLDVQTLAELYPGPGVLMTNAVFDPELTASLVVHGAPEGPSAHVMVSMTSTGVRVPPEQQGIARSIQAAVELLPDGTHVSAVIDQGEGRGTLTAFVEVGLGSAELLGPKGLAGKDPTLAGRVESRSFDLAGLSRLLPDIFGPSRGALTVDLSLDGTLGHPILSGALEAYFDELSIAAAGLAKKEALIRIDIDGKRLLLSPIHWEDDGGTLDLEFALTVPALDTALMTMDGKVALNRYQLLRRGDIQAKLSGDITVVGPLAGPTIRGNVTIDDATIDPQIGGRSLREVGPPEDVVFAAAWELEAQRATNGSIQVVQAPRNGLVVELGVVIPPRAAHLRSDMLDIFVEGDLQVQRYGGNTSIEGVISVVEGSVELEGRRFVIAEDSRVIFGGGQTVDPRLQISADYDIAEADLSPIGLTADTGSRIIVEISGKASQPNVNLRSDPPMDDSNIMSVLLLGSPVGGGGPGAAAALERGAVGVFVGAATGRFTRLVQGALSIDVLRVEGGEQSLADAKVTVGKRLTRDLLLMYQANLGAKEGENANEVRVDYRIFKGLHLETRFGDAGRGSLDLLYRWRY